MPVPSHCLLVWSGVFGTALAPIEEWQFSLKCDYTLVNDEDDVDNLALAMSQAYDANLKQYMPADTVLVETEFAKVNLEGKYSTRANGSYVQGIWEGAIAGTGIAGGKMPLQTALTVSLVTARSGPTGKGRFYLPFPSVNLDATYRLSPSTGQQMATAAANFVGDVNAICGPVVVASSKGYTSAVTAVRVGLVPDTQRRRRGDLLEAYITEPLT